MVQFIKNVILQFGGRYFGSEQEKKAQIYTKGVLEQYCDKTEIIPFESALEAHFQSLKIFCIVYVLSLIAFKFNIVFGAFLSVSNTVLFLGHFVTYRHWLDFLFKKKTSYNVIGDIEPIQTATSTIIISGHIDSVKEFKWWYRLKHAGAVLSVIAGFLFPLLSVFMVLAIFVHQPFIDYIWIFFLLCTPILIVYFDMHGDIVVDGALDNLTGVAMAVEMAKVFSEEKLQHTRIRCISFGSEEAGLRGAWHYGKTNKKQLLDEKAFMINLDTIKDLEHMTIGTRETNTLVSFDKNDIAKMEESFKATGVFYRKLPLDVGASDASAFRILGLPALSIIGMMSERLDICYHTRLDNIENLDGAAMEAMKKVLIHFIQTWDKKAK
ncbi:MAG: M28 family peptidase [Bacteroidetes bacterium]|nr:M28 family peptidase [Bacteroidota bacterium]